MQLTTPCIEWTGYRDRQGYGRRSIRRRLFLVHRLAWEEANGPIPDDLCVLHACDNPPCMNPEHLFLGTRADNNADMDAKGRRIPANSLKTHCPRGHPYDEANTYAYKGRRQCRACWRYRKAK